MKNRANGAANPDAMYQNGGHRRRGAGQPRGVRAAAPLDAVHARTRAPPPSCCGRAGSRRRARGPCRRHRAAVAPARQRARRGHAARRGWSTTPPSPPRARWPRSTPTRRPGSGPTTIDLAEVQDTDAARELLAYEELGFCGRGEAGAWFAAGHSQPGGRLPVNMSGGPAVEGRAARGVGPRPRGRAGPPAPGRGRRPPGRGGPGRPGPQRRPRRQRLGDHPHPLTDQPRDQAPANRRVPRPNRPLQPEDLRGAGGSDDAGGAELVALRGGQADQVAPHLVVVLAEAGGARRGRRPVRRRTGGRAPAGAPGR